MTVRVIIIPAAYPPPGRRRGWHAGMLPATPPAIDHLDWLRRPKAVLAEADPEAVRAAGRSQLFTSATPPVDSLDWRRRPTAIQADDLSEAVRLAVRPQLIQETDRLPWRRRPITTAEDDVPAAVRAAVRSYLFEPADGLAWKRGTAGQDQYIDPPIPPRRPNPALLPVPQVAPDSLPWARRFRRPDADEPPVRYARPQPQLFPSVSPAPSADKLEWRRKPVPSPDAEPLARRPAVGVLFATTVPLPIPTRTADWIAAVRTSDWIAATRTADWIAAVRTSDWINPK